MNDLWKLTVQIKRYKPGRGQWTSTYNIQIHPDEYVLDAVEQIWAYQDRSLVYRHLCHHSTCGACGMRVNHREKLACITRIRDITRAGGTILIEPLRNMPVISDLAVDMGQFFRLLDEIDYDQVQPAGSLPTGKGIRPDKKQPDGIERLVDCLECGLCVSACPAGATSGEYMGPAALAAIQLSSSSGYADMLDLADSEDGAWRCHSAFACTDVCPSNVEPGWRIMDLRKKLIARQLSVMVKKNEVTHG
jgi:succinate dehydrogenase / fumarate reductase iron-sulfur subunit